MLTEDIAKEALAKQGTLMGDVTPLDTTDDDYIKARQDIYVTSFEDIQLQVRAHSIIARWNNGVGVITVERSAVSGVPNVRMEQLEGSANRRATCHKIARLLHGLDSFDRLSDGDGEYADRMHAVCTLLQAVFTDNDTGDVNVEFLLSMEGKTTAVDAMDNDDGFGERKEQLLKRINTLLTGYVTRQLKELFPDTTGVIVEASVEVDGEETKDLMDPSNWAGVARRGDVSYPVCEVSNIVVVVEEETEAPSGVVVGNEEVTYVKIEEQQGEGAILNDKHQREKLLKHQQLEQQQLSLQKQRQQQQKLQQKQQQQQQQHTGDSSSDQDSESAKSTASFNDDNVRHSETKHRTSNSRTASPDSGNDVSGRKTSRRPGHL